MGVSKPERTCLCGNARPGPWDRSQCVRCWHQLYGPASVTAKPAAPRRSPSLCSHGKGDLGKTVACPTCNGNVRLKVFACELHGEATARTCEGCPDFTSPDYQAAAAAS
jgi:hypothetical protein